MELTQANRKLLLLAAPVAAGAVWAAWSWTSSFASLPFPHLEVPEAAMPLVKLVTAAAIGFLVTAAQRIASRESLLSRPMDQAQILLCVGSAIIVTLIGDSLARAVGVLGGAAIVRFRTPVDDPKEATILFSVLGLGMACGLGYYAFAGLAALFLMVVLISFGQVREQKLRSLSLQLVFAGGEPPIDRIEQALGRFGATYEPREISKGERTVVRYSVCIPVEAEISGFSQQLLADGEAAVQSISWDTPKKERYL